MTTISTCLRAAVDALPSTITRDAHSATDDVEDRQKIGQTIGRLLLQATSTAPTATTDFDDPCCRLSADDLASRICASVPMCSDAIPLALCYVDRLVQCGAVASLTRANAGRLFAVAFVVASKFSYDRVYSNKFYGKVGLMPIELLNQLELKLALALDFKLAATEEAYQSYAKPLAALSFLELEPERDVQMTEPETTPRMRCSPGDVPSKSGAKLLRKIAATISARF